jgi:hypothetical protein
LRISGTAEAAMIGFLAGQMCLSAVLPAPEARAAPPAPANDATLCRAAIATAEAQTRIPDEFLSAIGRVESGRPLPGAGLTPWPWTINAAGTGHFYASRQDAIEAARGFLASGVKSIDVGCLQVNLMYHPEAFVSLNEAFDPAANAAYAARLLLSLFQQQRSWPRAAAAYHSETPALGQAYQQKVLAAWAEPEGGPAPAATPLLPPFLHAAEKPQAAMPATSSGSVAGAPVAGFQRSFRLPGAAAPLPTGRLLAAYRAFPVRLAAGPPVFAPRVIK